MNRLAESLSPYLRQHADNPVDWWPWGDEPFEEARRRDVPVLVSIGYATCHWCHVMARESFSDPDVAAVVNERFVSIKVDREEHPEVDSAYMTAASAFTQGLGWPLTIFATPDGATFFASTYSPPVPTGGHPSFRQVLDAVWEAWTSRRDHVDDTAARLAAALTAAAEETAAASGARVDLQAVVDELAQHEDSVHGGFGGAPKFPVAPALLGLLRVAGSSSLAAETRNVAAGLARRTLGAMAASPLRDPVDGGFFRYGTRRDWSEPHYERMLYDNAQLLRAYSAVGDETTAEGIVRFFDRVLRVDGGMLASAQDSESILRGVRDEGGYYRLSDVERASEQAPAIDAKVLTGWNGLAISALVAAGRRFGREEWLERARVVADGLLERHVRADRLVRASLGGVASPAVATLEDYGSFALALLELALATGHVGYAVAGRDLLDRIVDPHASGSGLRTPGGGDPTLRAQGRELPIDPGEGASPSGVTLAARAALILRSLTGDDRYRSIAEAAVRPLADLVRTRALSMGGALEATAQLQDVPRELVVVSETRDDSLVIAARTADPGMVIALVTRAQAEAFALAGFDLFADRSQRSEATAYLCEDRVCRLPITKASELAALLEAGVG